MSRKASEITVQFSRPPAILFGEGDRFDISPNSLVIRIQPNEGVTLTLNSKKPGLETQLQPVELSFGYDTTFGSDTPEAYERLILDAMNGDGTLFIRGDETETSWSLLTPVLEHWAGKAEPKDSAPMRPGHGDRSMQTNFSSETVTSGKYPEFN